MRPVRALLPLLLAAATSSCLIQRSQPGVLVSSTPPGAKLFVDGRDSGFLTPAAISLSRRDPHRLDVELEGYRTASRIVTPDGPVHVVPWTAGYVGPQSFWFPIFLPIADFLLPVRIDDGFSPERIHIALELDDRP